MAQRPAVIVDVDGTLVDSTFQHALCWHQAFTQYEVDVTVAAAHSFIGMGADQLVVAAAGEDVEASCGDALRAAHDALFAAMLPTIRALPDAARFLRAVGEHQPVVLGSSAGAHEIEHYVDLLGVRDVVVGWTTADDVRPDQAPRRSGDGREGDDRRRRRLDGR